MVRLPSRLCAGLIAAAAAFGLSVDARAQATPFLGSWNLTGTGPDSTYVYWLEVLEVKGENGQLTGRFLNRVGSPVSLGIVKVDNGELVFQTGRPDQPSGPEYRARLEDGKLVGRHTLRTGGRGGRGGRGGGRGGGEAAAPTERVVNWVGVRRPEFPAADANANHTFGTPVVLFDGTSMDAFVPQFERPLFWAVVDGLLANVPPANNLVSKETFGDFKIEMEYRLASQGNSGVYLRGRYELQLFDDRGQPPAITGHMSIYGRTAASVNASRGPYQWQQMTAIVVGDRVTVTLNDQRVQDNAVIGGITGGALDNNELAPGPIMIQGDHSHVAIRRIVVTPIVN